MTALPPAAFVLVVDDEPAICDMMARILARCLPRETPPSVATAGSPEEALGVLDALDAAAGPWLVISDFNMGSSMDGIGLIEEVQRRQPEARCVLMSGYARAELGERGERVRLDAFMQKPWRLADASALLKSLAAGGA